MRKLLFLIGIISLSGCLTTRTYTKEEPRRDLSIEGNQGCLSGECPQETTVNRLGDTRTVSVVEVEFGSRGKEDAAKDAAAAKVLLDEMESPQASGKEDLVPASRVETLYYVVQDNDTLQKVSDKFYGTTKKWNFIYESNRDVLRSPDRLYPGVKIKIPPLVD